MGTHPPRKRHYSPPSAHVYCGQTVAHLTYCSEHFVPLNGIVWVELLISAISTTHFGQRFQEMQGWSRIFHSHIYSRPRGNSTVTKVDVHN